MNVLILGASVRAAAWSARRAGLSPLGLDLFADEDLAAAGPCRRVLSADDDARWLAAARGFPAAPFFYTGGLENRPDLIEGLSQERQLWGNGAEAIQEVRDPWNWTRVLKEEGHAALEVVLGDVSNLARDGSWLAKPIRSAGGLGIRRLTGSASESPQPGDYHQRRVSGLDLSAVFVGERLIGITRQYVGIPGAPFGYRGSLGPWPVEPGVEAELRRIGETLTRRFRLLGLFGVDIVLDSDGCPWPVEINPRYTASVEVLEFALGRSLLAEHVRVFEAKAAPTDRQHRDGPTRCVGKMILHAEFDGVFRGSDGHLDQGDLARLSRMADLPAPGTPVRAGDPVLTVFASGPTPEACEEGLRAELERASRLLGPV